MPDVPKLKIENSNAATAIFYVRITSAKINESNAASFVEAAILRPVDIRGDSAHTIFKPTAKVWDTVEQLTGPTYNMGSRIRDFLNDAVTEFAAQYYKDNP